MLRFILTLLGVAIGLPFLVIRAASHGFIPTVPSFLHVSTWMMAFITAVIVLYLYRLDKPSLFVRFYLISLVVKLLTALVYCLLMVLKDQAGGKANIAYFLALYVFFTMLEIVFLYKKITASRQP